MFKAVCASCGKELMMEVALPPEKDLICLDCFRKSEEK
jgi:hypothetical protein